VTQGIPSLTGLRGIAAAWVLLFHIGLQARYVDPLIGQVLSTVAGGGFLGVDFFFVLSGFVIALNYSGDAAPTSVRSYLHFLKKRLARIYPVHVMVLLLLVAGVALLNLMSIRVARPWSRDAAGLLESAFLVQGWAFPIKAIWNIPSWSVSVEWLAYLLFPLVSLLATRLPSVRTKAAAACILLCVLPIVIVVAPQQGTMSLGLPRIAVEFSLGVLLYCGWTATRRTLFTRDQQWLAIVAALVLGNVLANKLGAHIALMLAPVLAGTLIWILACGKEGSDCLTSAPAQQLGKISYSLYLVHDVWILFAQSLMRHFDWVASTSLWAAAMTVVLIGSLASAQLLYALVEEPARRWLAGGPNVRDQEPPQHPMTKSIRPQDPERSLPAAGGPGGVAWKP